jgi:hypothetical protein
LRAVAELLESPDLPGEAVRSGAIRHVRSNGGVNDVELLLELAELAKPGQILVSGAVYESVASDRLKQQLVRLDEDTWILSCGRGPMKSCRGSGDYPEPCCGPDLLSPAVGRWTGPPRMYWGRTVQMAQAHEEIISGFRNLVPD